MAKKAKPATSTDTRVTVTILGDAYVRKAAITVERGDSCVLRTVEITGDPDWNEILRPALAKLTEIEISPLPEIQTTAEDDINKPAVAEQSEAVAKVSDPDDDPDDDIEADDPEDETVPDSREVHEMEIVDPEDYEYEEEPEPVPVPSRPILHLQPTPKRDESPRQKALF